MARPDFYVILGVHRHDTPERIRAAYRRLAKRLHPDRAGDESTRRFQEISEAYRTLSDPGARRAYDAGDASETAPRASAATAEPLHADPVELFDRAARYRPSFDSLQERYLRNFSGGWVPKGEVIDGLNVEVLLSAEEARRGLVVPIEVPTLEPCDACDGAGELWTFPCTACRRLGRVVVPRTLNLHLRPPVASGSVHEIPLDHLGVHNFFLRVYTAVQ
jgi:DnaJ-class molecular chaperone